MLAQNRLLPFLIILSVAAAQNGADSDPAASAAEVRILRLQEEVAVRVMAFRTAEHYRRRDEALRECGCSHHFCGYDFGGDAACEEFPLAMGDLGCQNKRGRGRECRREKIDRNFCGAVRQVSYNNSFVRTPPGINIAKIADHPAVAEDICITKMLDGEKIFHRATFPEYCGDFNGWATISSPSGAFRVWPGIPAKAGGEECPEFDPRVRPWYQSATRGSLNAVVVLDKSGPDVNWKITKEAAKMVLRRFIYLDFVNFVAFSDKPQLLRGDRLFSAGIGNRNAIVGALDTISSDGNTVVDYGAALSMAFSVFSKTSQKEKEEGDVGTMGDCQKVIVFMAHSPDCSEVPGVKCSMDEEEVMIEGDGRGKLLNKIQALQAEFQTPVTLLTYGVGADVDAGLMQQMACQNDGISSRIEDESMAAGILESLFDFAGLGLTSEEPMWSEPYNDAFGLATVTSITMPIFLEGGVRGAPPRCFVGLAGHDVQIQDPGSGSSIDNSINMATMDAIVAAVIKTRKCLPIVGGHDACKLQALRGEHGQCQARLPPSTCYEFTNIAGEPTLYAVSEGTANGESPQVLDFDGASSYCSSKGGNLAMADSFDTQQFLAGIAPPDRSWIGLKRNDASSEWEWANGAIADNQTLSRLWASGGALPDENDDRRCAALDPGSTSRNVRPVKCDEILSFICELPATAADCEGSTLPLTFENLTQTYKAQDDRLKCEIPDECGFSKQTPKGDVLCPLGVMADDECCTC